MTLTDHSTTAEQMREEAGLLTGTDLHHLTTRRLVLNLAADLLEMHDATGISLDQWETARDFVQAVAETYRIDYTFTPNHA